MDMDARQVATCLPAETLARIEEIKAREARRSAALSGVGAGEGSRAIPAKREEDPAGKVIQMPLRKGSTYPHTGRPACVVLPFRKSIDRGHGYSAPA